MCARSILLPVSFCLGVLSLVAMFFMHLTLTDIYHGEADVTLEWNVVRAAALVILTFVITALGVLWRGRNAG